MIRSPGNGIQIAIVGTVGLPANYGGFETLVANLVLHAERHNLGCRIEVFCSSRGVSQRLDKWHQARLIYVPINANGMLSPFYDVWSMLLAARRGADTILVLGVSGTLVLPLLRLFTRARYIVNVDGLEWRRAKWNRVASWFLRISEASAARFAHLVIGDNQAIVEHIATQYGRTAELIAYGGDNAGEPSNEICSQRGTSERLPDHYALMLCRIEPENNVDMILEAFSLMPGIPLVAVGNWQASVYGRALKERYEAHPGIILLDPIYEEQPLYSLRNGAALYIHGHSAGGTNPSLVEMMYLAKPVAAFNCSYNLHSTEKRAAYFADAHTLFALVRDFDVSQASDSGDEMRAIALRRYRWDDIGRQYFNLMISNKCDAVQAVNH